MEQENKELLLEFLNMPISSGDEIFNKFNKLPKSFFSKGTKPLERYLYIPGTRDDRVVLVAHVDTEWDKTYGHEAKQNVLFNEGIFYGENKECGIGADDRAGCAMLWKLRDCGHSILLLDGEEYGKHGARYLKKSNRKLFRELNNHCFMIELDHKRTNHVSFAQVYNTKKFKKHFCEETKFIDKNIGGGCDLQILCDKICGANVGVGYNRHHTVNEQLILKEWENTYTSLSNYLEKEQKRFKIPVFYRGLRFFKKCIQKALIILKIKK